MEDRIKKYKEIARIARLRVLDLIYKAQTSHIGSNFSAIDILSVLYNTANVDKDMKQDRDRIVISKGWVAASVYHFLSEKGIISKKDLETFCQNGSKYVGLVEPDVRGIEAAGGSMGFGLPFAVGFALAKKINKENGRVFVLMGDGEVAIGTTWESALIAAQQELNNLTVIIDANGLQAMGKVKDVLNIEPLKDKWKAFGWEVETIDGHNYKAIEKAITIKGKKAPKIIIAKTVKGKGWKRAENNNIYHYKAPTKAEYAEALKEIRDA